MNIKQFKMSTGYEYGTVTVEDSLIVSVEPANPYPWKTRGFKLADYIGETIVSMGQPVNRVYYLRKVCKGMTPVTLLSSFCMKQQPPRRTPKKYKLKTL